MKTRARRWTPILVVPAVVLALAGCSSDDSEESSDAPSPSATDPSTEPSATNSPTAPTTSPPDLKPLPVVGRATGAIVDIAFDVSSCETSPGRQSVSGTVTNPTDDPTGYLIAISWNDDSSNTLARGFTIVRGARPGVETPWTIKTTVGKGASECVPFVLRGVIKK